jgi:hypothetical protein
MLALLAMERERYLGWTWQNHGAPFQKPAPTNTLRPDPEAANRLRDSWGSAVLLSLLLLAWAQLAQLVLTR